MTVCLTGCYTSDGPSDRRSGQKWGHWIRVQVVRRIVRPTVTQRQCLAVDPTDCHRSDGPSDPPSDEDSCQFRILVFPKHCKMNLDSFWTKFIPYIYIRKTPKLTYSLIIPSKQIILSLYKALNSPLNVKKNSSSKSRLH